MRTKQIKLYKFKELNKPAKARAIEKNRDINVRYEWWDFMIEDFQERIKEIGLSCKDIYFDIYNNHLVLDKPIIENPKLFMVSAGLQKWMVANELSEEALEFTMGITDDNEINRVNIDDPYKVNWESQKQESEYMFDEEERKQIDDIQAKLSSFIQDTCQKFLKELRDQEDYLSSNEAIAETLEANEYEFLHNGERY